MAIHYLHLPVGDPGNLLVTTTRTAMRREFGLVSEPIALHAPAPAILAAVWATLRETVLVGMVPRRNKETVAAAISRLNGCPYCIDAHASLLHATGARAAAQDLWRGREVADAKLGPVIAWAAASRSPEAPILYRPPFSPDEAPEMIGTAACFHYINRMVSLFLGETPFPAHGRLLRWPVFLLTSRMFSPYVRYRLRPGESLSRLAPAELPEDLAWARPSPTLAGAFARFAAAVEDAAREALPEEAARAIRRRIEAWRGEELPLAGSWVAEATEGLAPGQRPAARLALLAALAPYRVDAAEIGRFREAWPDDRSLVAVAAWGSFTASRRIAGWLAAPGA